MDIRKLSAKDRQKVLERQGRQSATNQDGKAKHNQVVDKFYDQLAEKMEPIVHEHLRKEGQKKKYF